MVSSGMEEERPTPATADRDDLLDDDASDGTGVPRGETKPATRAVSAESAAMERATRPRVHEGLGIMVFVDVAKIREMDLVADRS